MRKYYDMTAPKSAMPLVAVKLPKETCYKILREMRDWPEENALKDPASPDLFGDEGTAEFSLIMALATMASNLKDVAALDLIRFAEFFVEPSGPLILLSEEGKPSGTAYLIAPRPCEGIYKTVKILNEELQAALNGEAA